MTIKLPGTFELEASLLKVLSTAKLSLTSGEIDELVSSDLMLSPEQLELIHVGSRSEISYRLAWVRTKAKQKELIRRLPNNRWEIIENTMNK